MPTDPTLADVDAKVAQMTPGDWEVRPGFTDIGYAETEIQRPGDTPDTRITIGPPQEPQSQADAEGICALKNGYPQLRRAVTELQLRAHDGLPTTIDEYENRLSLLREQVNKLEEERDTLRTKLEEAERRAAEAVHERLEIVEQHAPDWLRRLEAHGTGIDRGDFITEFPAGIDGVAYILRAYHESHARQKRAIRDAERRIVELEGRAG